MATRSSWSTWWRPGWRRVRWESVTDSGLCQEVVYQRVPAARRAQLHRRIGEREEVGYGPQARERAAVLAMHFGRGRDHDRALRYLQHAADNALRRSAYTDAITHLTNA